MKCGWSFHDCSSTIDAHQPFKHYLTEKMGEDKLFNQNLSGLFTWQHQEWELKPRLGTGVLPTAGLQGQTGLKDGETDLP